MFDPDLLQTFLAVAETHSFTGAAARLGLSQPTVSQQIRKLEEASGRRLVMRDTRQVSLTDNGDAMAGFARTILAAHATASAYFTGAATRGRLRFGAADDLAATQLPRILRHFRQLHPQINLELVVTQSTSLHRRLKAGQLDLIFIKQHPEATDAASVEKGTVARNDTMVWMAQERTLVDPDQPVPLIVYQAPSVSRKLAIEALEAAGRPWRVTCNTREVSGVLAAVRAGLGVAVYPHSLIPDDLIKVSDRFSLPKLGRVAFTLVANPLAPTEPVEALSSLILQRSLG